MKKNRLVPFLLFPLLLSNSPAPGAFSREGEVTYDKEREVLVNTGETYLSHISYTIPDGPFPQSQSLIGYNGIQGNGDYYLLPPGDSLPQKPLEDGESFSAGGYLEDEDLFFDIAKDLQLTFVTEEGKTYVEAEGSFRNPSNENISYLVGIYTKTERGYHCYLENLTLGKEEEKKTTLKFLLTSNEEKDFSTLLLVNNPYYTNAFYHLNTFEIIGIVILSLILLITLSLLTFLILKLWRRHQGKKIRESEQH